MVNGVWLGSDEMDSGASQPMHTGETGSSRYFTHSPHKNMIAGEDEQSQKRRRRRAEMDSQNDDISSDPVEYGGTADDTEAAEEAARPSKGRRLRQGILIAKRGQLVSKKPLVNPVKRNDPSRKALQDVAKETARLLPGLLLTRPDIICDSFLCQGETIDPKRCPGLTAAKIRVVNSDTIDLALVLDSTRDPKDRPVAVLNMANAETEGGGWLHGSKAQEEAICYRTSLSATFRKKHYPIPEDAATYHPTVLVFRKSMENDNELLNCRIPSELDMISVISCAAVEKPELKKDSRGNVTYKDKEDFEVMKEKMRIILRTAIRNKHRQLVLGAFGCGAFSNPPEVVALLWKDVLLGNEFAGGYWKDVCFAVLDATRDNNFDTFKKVLDGVQV